jgi:phospholipase C
MEPSGECSRSFCRYSSLSSLTHRNAKTVLVCSLLVLWFVVALPSSVAQVTLTPASLSFGDHYLGTITGSTTIILTNGQTVPLQISSIAAKGGTGATDFPIGIICPLQHALAAGASCTINVRFQPQALGSRSATLTVTDNAAGSPQTETLGGTGIAPVTVAPTSLTFPSQPLKTTSAAMTVVLTNHLSSSVSFLSVSASGDFAVASNSCAGTIGARAQCSIGVTFTPTIAGPETGTLTISDSAAGSPTTLPLRGTGASGGSPVSLSPSTITFGNQYLGTITGSTAVTLTNAQPVPLQISSIVVTGGTGATDFPIGIICPQQHPLAAGSSCNINVRFQPQALGTRSSTLTVTDNASNSPQRVALGGIGLSAVTVSPASLTFASEPVNTTSPPMTVTVTNNLGSTLSFSSIQAGGEFAVASNTCGASIAGHKNCSIGVTFTPTATGTQSGTLTVADNAPGSPTVIRLSGAGASAVNWGNIQHVIIIFQENRTPDNLFQDPVLIAKGADIAGSGMNSSGQIIALSPMNLGSVGPNPQIYDIGHGRADFLYMYDGGKMDGADKESVNCFGNTNCPPPNPQFKYVDPSDVAPYFQLAEQYTFGDRMFQTNQGPSFPAHQFIISGTSAPTATSKSFASGNVGGGTTGSGAGCIAPPSAYVTVVDPLGKGSTMYPCFEHPTLTDLLEAAGISWRYYAPTPGSIWTGPDAIEHMCGPNAPPPNATACVGQDWVDHVSVTSEPNHTTVLQDIANGRLASVSWVIPSGLASDHAAQDNGTGPSWVASVVNAVGSSPYWSNTAIIITWDDWGGWYDHVAPKVINDGVSWGSGYVYGFRVPLIVVSPYAKTGYISHVTHDFGSILNFIEQVYDLPSLGYADAHADDLSDCFNFNQSPTPFKTITAPLNIEHFLKDKTPPTDPDDD